jgi:glycosyltransferase involved in cell wall biosynthesis
MTNNDFPIPYRVAVLIPCYNEALTIRKVIQDFRTALPGSTVYVYDNNSTDETIKTARQAGAVVRKVPHQGKGNVVRRMFADIEADIYVLVDGDDTYDATSAPKLMEQLIMEQLDMVVGTRFGNYEEAAFRSGHHFGNHLLTAVVGMIFERSFTDMLSGYRVFSRRFVKSFPALAKGFETETELTVHALELRMPIAEVITDYKSRPPGSESKLHTYRDGYRILKMILRLFREERPLFFFTIMFAILAFASVALAYPLFVTYLATGLVPRFPTAILSTGLMLLAFLNLGAGLILDTVTKGRMEIKRLAYLSIPAIGFAGRNAG